MPHRTQIQSEVSVTIPEPDLTNLYINFISHVSIVTFMHQNKIVPVILSR